MKQILLLTFCLLLVTSYLPADAIYLKNGRTVEGKIVSENDKAVTLEIGYGTITINRDQIKEVVAEEWTPPKPAPKISPAPETGCSTSKPITPTPVSNIQALLDSYAQNEKHKEINKHLVQIINLPEDKEPWTLFDDLAAQTADEAEYLLLLLKEIRETVILKWVILLSGRHQIPAAVKPMFEMLSGDDETLKLAVLDAFRYMKNISTTHLVRGQLPKEKSPRVKTAIINALFTAEDKESLVMLVDYLNDPDTEVRKAATNAIISIARKCTADELRSYGLMGHLKDKVIATRQKETRQEIISIFGQLKSPEAVDILMTLMTDENAEIRSDAAMALGSIGDKQATGFLMERIQKEEDEWTVMQIIGALQKTNDKSSIPAIIEALRDGREKVRLCAARALRNMTPHAFGENYDKWKEWWEKEQARPR
ncbi:MAG: HEAT repeat domain-containing protein [Planctomycetota bacterium]